MMGRTLRIAGIMTCAAWMSLVTQAHADFKDAEKELRSGAASQAVKQGLTEKGAYVQFTSGGGWRVYGAASAPCDSESEEDFYSAKSLALMKAKSNISTLVNQMQEKESAAKAKVVAPEPAEGEAPPEPKVSRIERLAADLGQILQGTVTFSFKKVKGEKGSVVHVAAGSSPAVLAAMGIVLASDTPAEPEKPAKKTTKKKTKPKTEE